MDERIVKEEAKRIPYGMMNFVAVCEDNCYYVDKTRFTNEVVREQVFSYLLDTYKENDLTFDSSDIRTKEKYMAYRGVFKPFFQYIADCIYTFSSQRDRQKGEAVVHGFPLARTCQCRFYRPISELDNQNGYADVFLCPRCAAKQMQIESRACQACLGHVHIPSFLFFTISR